jgi:hypothetical protein
MPDREQGDKSKKPGQPGGGKGGPSVPASRQNDREEEKGGPRPAGGSKDSAGNQGKPGKAERGRGDD